MWFNEGSIPEQKHARVQLTVWADSAQANTLIREIEDQVCGGLPTAESFGAAIAVHEPTLHVRRAARFRPVVRRPVNRITRAHQPGNRRAFSSNEEIHHGTQASKGTQFGFAPVVSTAIATSAISKAAGTGQRCCQQRRHRRCGGH